MTVNASSLRISKNVLRISVKDLRFLCFLFSITIYALWGTPTPDVPGLPELMIGTLLIGAAGMGSAGKAIRFDKSDMPWERACRALLLYGASVPVLIALASGNDSQAIVRDLVFFVFFLLPLFMHPLFRLEVHAETFTYDARKARLLLWAVLALGTAFSVRVLLPFIMDFRIVSDPAYLANAPTVLFAALFLSGLCGLLLYRGDYAGSLFLLLLSLIPLATMALIVQRASIGAALLAAVVLLGIGLVHRPLRLFMPLAFIGLAALIYSPFLDTVFQNAIHKTAQVGLNMRWQEAREVFAVVGDSLFSALFGKGWGSSVFSPAAGGVTVNFTHSLVTTFWLKTGLAGVLLALFYLSRIGAPLARLFFRNPVLALALAAPFLIDILFYASFKSLDFGLLLLLIVLFTRQDGFCERLQKSGSCSMQEKPP